MKTFIELKRWKGLNSTGGGLVIKAPEQPLGDHPDFSCGVAKNKAYGILDSCASLLERIQRGVS